MVLDRTFADDLVNLRCPFQGFLQNFLQCVLAFQIEVS